MKLLRSLTVLLAFALLVSACGDDGADVAGGGGDDTTTTTTVAGGRGWLEGDDLDWAGSSVFEGDAAPADFAADAASTAGGEERSGALGDIAPVPVPEPPFPEPPVDTGPLQAGSIDDGDDVAAYLAYRQSIRDAGVAVRPLDVTDSTVITVTGDNGLPVLDAVVEVWDPLADATAPLVELRTTANGTVRFLPVPSGGEGIAAFDVTVTVGDATETVSFDRGEPAVAVAMPVPGGVDGSVPLDVHFVLDATGSMDDEIARLRDNMTSIAEQIAALPSAPDVRFGMTVYRDEGDLFVTRTFDLTGSLQDFLDALPDVTADGGGDYPEAMDEALADALDKPEWRRDGAVEVMILIADAPPQIGRQVSQGYNETALAAAGRGVKIFPVAASGTDDQAEYVMRELAFVTGGRFVFLSYGVGGTATGGRTDITPDDYDELPLDQLVVRLVQDELAALQGEDLPPVTTTTTTVPVTTTTYTQ